LGSGLLYERVVGIGAFHRTGDEGHFDKIEVFHILVKVVVSRNSQASPETGHEKLVNVHFKDFLFGVSPFEKNRLHELFQFGLVRFSLPLENILCGLLGDGAPSLSHFSGPEVSNRSPENRFRIKPRMSEKSSVFCGNKRLDEERRNFHVMNVFSVGFIKENPHDALTIIVIDRAFRKNDAVDDASVNAFFCLS
jgi:hypothetical protein